MSLAKHSRRTAAEHAPLYQPNIFPLAWPMVKEWGELDWGRGAVSRRSSQALAVDVFGMLALSPARDVVLDALAVELGLPAGGSWQVDLEWWDRDNALGEAQPTPLDVALRSPRLLLCVECKFAEPDGGVCKQTKPGKQLPAQCNGAYADQVNPHNGLRARCALTAKGACYWDWIPRLFSLNADQKPPAVPVCRTVVSVDAADGDYGLCGRARGPAAGFCRGVRGRAPASHGAQGLDGVSGRAT